MDVCLGRPLTLNRMLGGKGYRYAKKQWRDAGRQAALDHNPDLRFTPPVTIDVTVLTTGGRQQDVGSAMPAAKAVIDGLIDANWLTDDSPDIVTHLNFNPHQPHTHNGLRVTVKGNTQQ